MTDISFCKYEKPIKFPHNVKQIIHTQGNYAAKIEKFMMLAQNAELTEKSEADIVDEILRELRLNL